MQQQVQTVQFFCPVIEDPIRRRRISRRGGGSQPADTQSWGKMRGGIEGNKTQGPGKRKHEGTDKNSNEETGARRGEGHRVGRTEQPKKKKAKKKREGHSLDPDVLPGRSPSQAGRGPLDATDLGAVGMKRAAQSLPRDCGLVGNQGRGCGLDGGNAR